MRDVESIDCRADGEGHCTFVFSFAPVGLPDTAIYRIAVRTGNGPWTIVEPVLSGPADMPSFETGLAIDTPTSAPGNTTEVQFAVLVYLQPPDFIPAQVMLLGESGADLAFVTRQLIVSQSAVGSGR